MTDAILFVSFGGPEAPEEIMPFLEHVTAGRGIPRERLEGVAHHYMHMGGKSPINAITRRQAGAARSALAKAGDARPFYIGQRHAKPFLQDALARMRDDGVKTATAFITAAYASEASLERYVAAVSAARAAVGPGAPEISYVASWFDHPLFLDALAARAKEASAPEGAEWVFTAHSIPCAMAKDSVYVEQLRAAGDAVARRLGLKAWRLAFTSRSGNPRDAWLEPDVSKVIAEAAAKGVRDLAILPFGFVADHVEVLYDLDVEAKLAADAAAVRLHRAATVGEHPLFIEMIADVLRGPIAAVPSSASVRVRDGKSIEKAGKDSTACFCFPNDPNPPCRRVPAPGRLK